MRRFLIVKSYTPQVNVMLLILRVVVSGLMLTHGWPKLMKLINGDFQFADPYGMGEATSLVLATFAEFFCSILIIIGLGTRLATVPLLITMLTALLIVHGDEPFWHHPNIIMYILAYAVMSGMGSGKYSLDYKWFK